MTYNCREIIDDGVETFVYCPRSYVELDPDTTLNSKKLDSKSKSYEKISISKKSSLNDLRNAFLTRMNTPLGRPRSKTLVERSDIENIDGKTLKKALGRTCSLDISQKMQNKSSTDDLVSGFSKLADKTFTQSVKDQQTSSPRAGKDRSNSCPTNPVAFEEKRKQRKNTSEYDSITCSIDKSQVCSSFEKQHPTIKIELCSNENYGTDPLQHKLSHKTASKTSINSDLLNSSGSFSSNDNLSACISNRYAQNTTISKTAVNVIIDKPDKSYKPDKPEKGDQVKKSERKRPKSVIDIFRREKDPSRNCDTSPLPRKFNEQDDDGKKYPVMVLDSDSEKENVNRRSRPTNLIESNENKIKDKNMSNNAQDSQVKKASSNVYKLASSASLKKTFKKTKRVVHTSMNKNNQPVSVLSASRGQRKCVKIESYV